MASTTVWRCSTAPTPTSVDTDCDGLNDGAEAAAQTNPSDRDSDDDGITDGVESGGVCTVGTQTAQHCVDNGLCRPDADPGTTTNPRNADTDGDQVPDGAEDGNQDGYFDAAAGELNPNVDDVGQSEADACGLENLREVTLVQRPDDTADLILAVPQDFPVNRITELRDGAGDVIGAMVFDPVDQVAGVAMKLTVAGADASTKLTTLQGILNGGVGDVTTFSSQSFTSWDAGSANNAAIGRLQWRDAQGGDSTAKSMNDIVQALVSGASGLLDTSGSSDVGEVRMEIEVLVRSATSTVVVIAMSNLAQTALDEQRFFKLDDLANGTAVAQFGDDTGVQCDRFQVEVAQKADFILVVDNSGSMDNEQTALANAAAEINAQLGASSVDYRVAVITSDLDETTSALAEWDSRLGPTLPASLGTCTMNSVTYNEGPRYCPFSTNAADLSTCIANLDVCGSGEEVFFRAFACSMGQAVSGDGITTNVFDPPDVGGSARVGGPQDGEMCGRGSPEGPNSRSWWNATGTYQTPPGTYSFLPRSAAGATDARKLRADAQAVVIFVSDANEQSDGRFNRQGGNYAYPGDATATRSIPTWVSYFANFDRAGDPVLSRALVHGITCANNSGCTDESGNYMNPRFEQFFAALGGVRADLPDNADPQNAQKIQDAIALILQQSISQTSPYVLAKPPISSTIKVAGEFAVVNAGACSASCSAAGCSDIPRSRENGFDYDGTTNSISFYGACRPAGGEVDVPFAVSYKYWIEDSPNPDGNNETCTAPFVSSPSGDCVCPSDCGVAGGLSAGQTCNPTTCEPECLADCGGCAAGFVCNVASPSCACECPADCNTGGSLPPGQVCDPATCLPTCAPGGCQGSPPTGSAGWTCGADCQWECASDCGDPAISSTERCNATTCTVECAPDCNATCGGYSECNSDPAVCACECAESASCAPGYAFNPDEAVCDCVCDAAALSCPATHTANLTDCRCECAPNCGDTCGAGYVCQESTCSCRPVGG